MDTISRDAIIEWIKNFSGAIAAQKEYLTQLDSAIGDADHGINMDRGFQAVLQSCPLQPAWISAPFSNWLG